MGGDAAPRGDDPFANGHAPRLKGFVEVDSRSLYRYIDMRAGEGRLIYHGLLLPLIVGSFAVSPGYPGAHTVVMLILVPALALGLYSLSRRRRPIGSRVGFAVWAAVLAFIVVKFRLYSPGINYNLLVFSPLVYLAVIFICLEISSGVLSGKDAGRLRAALHCVILAAFLLTSLGFVRSLVTFPRFLHNGVSFDEAKDRLKDLRRDASGSVLITPTLFGLVDDYDNMSVMVLPHHAVPKTHEIVVFAQVGLARQTPPQIDGYSLVDDRFDHDAPRIFGVKVANSSHGYAYAVYRRDRGAAVLTGTDAD